MQGFTDYTLAKRALLDEFRRGGLDRLDICDAHPELLRAAFNIGQDIPGDCPVCSKPALREVRFVYGESLKHLSGRPVYPTGWDRELAQQFDEFRCYSIEVCLECSWNHLAACYLMGRRYAAKRGSKSARKRTSTRASKGARLS